ATVAALLLTSLTATSCRMLGLDSNQQALAAWSETETVFFHRGIAAGPVLITGTGSAVVEERRYEPFGVPIDARQASNPPGDVDFTRDPQNVLGKMSDPSTGWSYHGARWMSPQSGRWLSPDPAVSGPDLRHLLSPWDLNPYQFARQNPAVYWD